MRRWSLALAALSALGTTGCDLADLNSSKNGSDSPGAGFYRAPQSDPPSSAQSRVYEDLRQAQDTAQYAGPSEGDSGRRSFDGDQRSFVDMGDADRDAVVQAPGGGRGYRPRATQTAFSDYRRRNFAAEPPAPGNTGRGGSFTDTVRDSYHSSADWAMGKFTNVSLAMGAPWAGKLRNGVPLPPRGEGYYFARYKGNWGTDALVRGIQWMGGRMKAQGHQPMEVWDLSNEDGGRIRGHKSHQNGCDVDIAFYRTSQGFDTKRNWDLLVSALENPHFQVSDVFVASYLRGRLLQYGQKNFGPNDAMVKRAAAVMSHEPNHEDHFHVRIFPPKPGPAPTQVVKI